MKRALCLSFLVCTWIAGCGPAHTGNPGGDPDGGDNTVDIDGDGYTQGEGDCLDTDPEIHPGALDETCDGVDNDCDGVVDNPFNLDGDPVSTCNGDCDDTNPDRYPGAVELPNGLDDDCDNIADNHTENFDDDGDGFSEVNGDCNDQEPLIGPASVEVPIKTDEDGVESPEGVDNDCDLIIDEGFVPCDEALDKTIVANYPKAIDLCNWVESVEFVQGDERGRNIRTKYGDTYVPHLGSSFALLSTGLTLEEAEPGWTSPEGGTQFNNSAAHPDPQPAPPDGCGVADPLSVNDYTELKLVLDVPPNANSLSYDFNFMSAEFPFYVCQFDDQFLAMLQSEAFTDCDPTLHPKGCNISFDDQGRPVTINIGFFDVCAVNTSYPVTSNCTGDAELAGTGFIGHGNPTHGGTGWLHTIAPVKGGETATLTFYIFDEGDWAWDSLVIIDNFQWGAEAVDGPVTIPKMIAPQVHRTLRAQSAAAF
jgi:putative metal-binding protein